GSGPSSHAVDSRVGSYRCQSGPLDFRVGFRVVPAGNGLSRFFSKIFFRVRGFADDYSLAREVSLARFELSLAGPSGCR
ncbi:hypothetical protein OIU85_003867, partial [Salix viminalis]